MAKWSRFLTVGLSVCLVAATVLAFFAPMLAVIIPDYRDIKDVIGDADSILVREWTFRPGEGAVGGKVLFEVHQPDEVRVVLDMISFRERGWRDPCHCRGYPMLEWRKGDDCLARVGFKHSSKLYWLGVGDCSLSHRSGDELTDWLIANGVDPKNAIRHGKTETTDSPPTHGREAESPSP